jgi:hypothetical protein
VKNFGDEPYGQTDMTHLKVSTKTHKMNQNTACSGVIGREQNYCRCESLDERQQLNLRLVTVPG